MVAFGYLQFLFMNGYLSFRLLPTKNKGVLIFFIPAMVDFKERLYFSHEGDSHLIYFILFWYVQFLFADGWLNFRFVHDEM